MAKRDKALPAAMAIVPSIAAPVPSLPEERHNDPEFWRTQAKMAKLDGRVILANEAELAAKRAERRTGKAPVVEEVNPIDANAERQIVQAAAEREARKPVEAPFVETVIPNQDPGPVMASSSIQDGQDESPDDRKESVETPVLGVPGLTITNVTGELAAGQIVMGVDGIETGRIVEVKPAKAKRGSAGQTKNAAPGRTAVSNEAHGQYATKLQQVDISTAPETVKEEAPSSPVLENGLTAEEEAVYQALAARRKPEPKCLTVKPGSITDRILAMLKDTGGHSVQEISDAMGWNKPSGQIIKVIRAAPFRVTMTKGADGRNRYTAG